MTETSWQRVFGLAKAAFAIGVSTGMTMLANKLGMNVWYATTLGMLGVLAAGLTELVTGMPYSVALRRWEAMSRAKRGALIFAISFGLFGAMAALAMGYFWIERVEIDRIYKVDR
jgi:hypothetical protein